MHDGTAAQTVNDRLAARGLRRTQHRQRVYDMLVAHRDHPTAEELFLRVKQTTPDISLATVYNCLDALIQCGLVRQVTVDRAAARFCANMREHFHFHCEVCDGLFDIPFDPATQTQSLGIPRGFQPRRYDIAVHGVCPACRTRRKP